MAKNTRKHSQESPIVKPTRKVPVFVRICLFVRAGGRCQFDSCNNYLLEHHVTLTEGNFAQFAHIVAFREDGPRGKETRPPDINDVSNLMLLCPKCHKLIDDHPGRFTRVTLEGYKQRHEERIRHVTGLGPEQKTSILVMKSKIGTQTVGIPFDHIIQALTPRYPYSKEGLTIDLTQLSVDSGGFIQAACDTIREQLSGFFGAGGEVKKTGHVSLFALAPMPLLAFLGNQLSNKVPLDLYQRHRDTEDWSWKTGGEPVKYSFEKIRGGTEGSRVVLMVALSGVLNLDDLPPEIAKDVAAYRLTLGNSVPMTTFLRTRRDLDEFRNQYQLAIATIVRDYPSVREIDFFPAAPAPIAVLCGRELLPKVHPALRIYDKDKNKGGFTYTLTINN
jgi:hypothetical protein